MAIQFKFFEWFFSKVLDYSDAVHDIVKCDHPTKSFRVVFVVVLFIRMHRQVLVFASLGVSLKCDQGPFSRTSR